MIARYLHRGHEAEADFVRDGDAWTAHVGGSSFRVEVIDTGSARLALSIDGKRVRARIWADGATRWVWIDGRAWRLEVPDQGADRRQADDAGGANDLDAPISGAVVTVDVTPGDAVEEGQVLVIVEAMKMEHRIRSPRGGIVAAVHCEIGAMVDQGMRLVDLEPEADEAQS